MSMRCGGGGWPRRVRPRLRPASICANGRFPQFGNGGDRAWGRGGEVCGGPVITIFPPVPSRYLPRGAGVRWDHDRDMMDRITRSLHPGTNSPGNRQIFCLRGENHLPYICRLCKSIVSRKCKANLLTPRLASRKVEGANRETATRMRPPVQRRVVEKEAQHIRIKNARAAGP